MDRVIEHATLSKLAHRAAPLCGHLLDEVI
jgi:hypothetical protein